LALLLVGAVLACHGVFGALHLCSSHQGLIYQEHGHSSAEKGGMDAHDEHSPCHLLGADYFAVLLMAFLGLALGLLLKGARSWIGIVAPLVVGRRFMPVVLYPPRGPTLLILQVFRL
jgi:hypothetical protein